MKSATLPFGACGYAYSSSSSFKIVIVMGKGNSNKKSQSSSKVLCILSFYFVLFKALIISCYNLSLMHTLFDGKILSFSSEFLYGFVYRIENKLKQELSGKEMDP